MDQSTTVVKSKANKTQSGTETVRVKKETKKKIQSLLLTINKKDFGRKIKPDDFLSIATDLIDKQHISKLQESSFSNKDRLEMHFKNYQQKNAKITKDEFIGMLLAEKNLSDKNSEDLV